MSYDLEIWSAEACQLPEGISFGGKWLTTDASATHAARDWQIIVTRSIDIEEDQIPDEISSALPGLSYLTELSLEPTDAPESAQKLFARVAKGLAATSHGLVFDRQGDSLHFPRGTKKLLPAREDEAASTLMLSWWLGPKVLQSTSDFIGMLEILHRYVPEALPRRYGTYEPPEHKFDGDIGVLAEFLSATARKSMVVWYPSKPVSHVSLSLPAAWGDPDRLGFKSDRLTIEFDAYVLSQPGRQLQIQRFWRKMSSFLTPFYGDVRHINGYRRHAGRLWGATDTKRHPVRSWFWRGIPATSGVAAVIGTPYREVWKEFYAVAENSNNLSYLSNDDWAVPSDVLERIPQRRSDLNDPNPYFEINDYPEYWPFGRGS